MRKPSPCSDFAAFFNVVVAISSTMASPACALSHQTLVCPGRTQNRLCRGSELRRFLRILLELKVSTFWSSFEIANCCRQKSNDFLTHVIRLTIRASKVANRALLSATLNLNFQDWTRANDLLDFKNFRFQSSTRICHSGQRFQERMVSVCAFTGFK